jgi:hypothetical protein
MLGIDIQGQVFGRFTVLRHVGKDKRGYYLWECQCTCGTVKIVKGSNLRRGDTLSCGCYIRDVTSRRSIKHNGDGTKEYRAWTAMKTRCYNPKSPSYIHYGQRGISVCDRWRNDFAAFLEDMGERPPKTSLDRIDSDKDYTPENCRWADIYIQNNNRRNNVFHTAGGETLTSAQWSNRLGIRNDTFRFRIKSGKKIEDMKEYQHAQSRVSEEKQQSLFCSY